MECTWPTHIKPSHTRQASRLVCQALGTPTCWYQQCQSLALGVFPNAKPQREGVALQWNIGLVLF